MDVAETALRLGFREVTVVYRRSEFEMPARREEIEAAKEEGTRFKFLTMPLRFFGDDRDRLLADPPVEVLQVRQQRARHEMLELVIEVDLRERHASGMVEEGAGVDKRRRSTVASALRSLAPSSCRSSRRHQ